MNVKEQEFLFDLIERVSEEVYKLGYADGEAGKPLRDKGFKVSKANRLTIKTNMKKLTERR